MGFRLARPESSVRTFPTLFLGAVCLCAGLLSPPGSAWNTSIILKASTSPPRDSSGSRRIRRRPEADGTSDPGHKRRGGAVGLGKSDLRSFHTGPNSGESISSDTAGVRGDSHRAADGARARLGGRVHGNGPWFGILGLAQSGYRLYARRYAFVRLDREPDQRETRGRQRHASLRCERTGLRAPACVPGRGTSKTSHHFLRMAAGCSCSWRARPKAR